MLRGSEYIERCSKSGAAASLACFWPVFGQAWGQGHCWRLGWVYAHTLIPLGSASYSPQYRTAEPQEDPTGHSVNSPPGAYHASHQNTVTSHIARHPSAAVGL